MEEKNGIFPKNLKMLRIRKQKTQEELAHELKLTRVKLNSLERGGTKGYLPEDLLAISNFFKISIDSLLRVDLTQLGELRLRDLEAGNDVRLRNVRVLAITVNEENEEHIEMVPIEAKAGYSAGFNDPDYIGTLPKYKVPGLPKGKTCRIFPTRGDSMLPIPENSKIVAAYVEDWTQLKNDTLCIVVLSGKGPDIVFKKVENRIDTNQSLMLHSLNNKVYQPYEVPVDEILEIWEMVSYQSDTVPEGNLSADEISATLKDIQSNVQTLISRAM